MKLGNKRERLLASTIVGGVLLSIAGSAIAQTVSSNNAQTDVADTAKLGGQTTQLGEVVVTAQKKSEKLLNVPTAITVLSADSLVQNNDLKLDDYFRSVPGLTLFDNGYGLNKLVIRGVTTGQGETPTVGIYIDDTPIGGSSQLSQGDLLAPDIDPSDLQQIEVLKGPQGTLYGAGAMGGLFKYVTVLPDSHTFSGRVGVDTESVAGGNAGYAVRGAVNIPLVPDQLALRVSASTRDDPGWINDIDGEKAVNAAQVQAGRLALLWTPAANLSVELTAMSQVRHSDGLNREDYNFLTNQPTYGDLLESRVPNADDDTMRVQQYNATVKADLGWTLLTSSTSFARSSFSGPIDLTYLFGFLGSAFGVNNLGTSLYQGFATNKLTQEIRLEGKFAPNIDYLAGVFYTNERSAFVQAFNALDEATGQPYGALPDGVATQCPPANNLCYGPDNLGYATDASIYQELAGFGDITYHFTPKFDVEIGGRYGYNWQSYYGTSNGALNGGPLPPTFGASNQGAFTFLVTPEYKLSADQMIYARVASGYRPGGPNYSAPGTSAYQSDTLINYEIGFKSDLLNHKAYFDISAYHIDWSNIQLEGVNSLDELTLSNGGAATVNGFETSGQYRPIKGLTLGANLSYTDAHLTQAVDSGDIYAPNGSRLPYSPRLSGQVSADYQFPVFDGWSAKFGGDYSYQGDRTSDFASSDGQDRITLPAYGVLNLNAMLMEDKYTVSLFFKNVANERGILSSANIASAIADPPKPADLSTVAIVQPRTIGVSLAAKF
jgi:outer membrane receptor protein involved in Fe transport